MALTVRDIVVDIYHDEMVPFLDSVTTKEVESYLQLPITGCYNTMMRNFHNFFLADFECPPGMRYFATIGDLESLCKRLETGYSEVHLDKCLSCAAANGHIDIVRHLVTLGATSEGIDVALYRAISNEHLDIVKYLLSVQPRFSAISWLGYLAGETGNVEIVDYLITQGADDIDGIIMHACDKKRYEVIEHLIRTQENEIDVDWVCDKLHTGKNYEAAHFIRVCHNKKQPQGQENKKN